MTASIKLPRMLAETVKTEMVYKVEGVTLAGALDDLFAQAPGLRHHIVDERGAIRPHVSLFVDGAQADLETTINDGADIRVLHAVSGG
jgi:molybdopterin synthase sulfur carrier subunit